MTTDRTVISFRVSVPVLSEQMTVTDPSVSTLGSFRINAFRAAMRCRPNASVRRGVDVTKHLLWGSPAFEVVRLAKDLKSDLVVMGTIGRRGVEGLLLGNTAESILTHCDCDVLAVKPVEFVSPITRATWPLHPGPEKTR